MDNYRIKYDDGTETYVQLEGEDVDRYQALAKDKTSGIKSVEKGDPKPATEPQ